MIYKPQDLPNLNGFMSQWNELIRKDGIADSFYFIAHINSFYEKEILCKIKDAQFDCLTFAPLGSRIGKNNTNIFKHFIHGMERRILMACGYPNLINYKNVVNNIWINEYDSLENVAPVLIPRWDHTPRSGRRGSVFINCTPENWEVMCNKVLGKIKKKKNKMVFLKSWNEWGEGNYMEPDLKFGMDYIHALKRQIENNRE